MFTYYPKGAATAESTQKVEEVQDVEYETYIDNNSLSSEKNITIIN